jgi:tetratricopeptide (TPR) repeat protein
MGRLFRNILICTGSLAFLATTLAAQRDQERIVNSNIQVRVTYENNRPAGDQIRLDLSNESGIPVAQAFTDTQGSATFTVQGRGSYRVKASGLEIEDKLSDAVVIQLPGASLMVFLQVKQKASATAVRSVEKAGSRPVASAAELGAPPEARKAFDKGLAAWQNKNYEKAAEDFEKAVALYPNYDTAYNNLGVMYAHLKQPEKSMAAFEHAVRLNDKNADADRNLARICIRQRDYVRAEDLLKKSQAVQPLDAGTLTMLSIAEIENGEFDAALIDARKVHGLPHDGYAVSHFVAGQALERKQQPQDAIAEYVVYLRESPNGPEVVQVKDALDRLSAGDSSAQSKMQ